MSESIKEIVARWRKMGNESGPDCPIPPVAAAVYRVCARELEDAKPSDLMCPVPELKGKVPLVLYFNNDADADEFTAMVQEAHPNFVSKKL